MRRTGTKSKHNFKPFYRFFTGMPITGKITLLYGLVFSFVLLLTSSFFIVNAVFSYINYSKEQLEETAIKVAGYVSGGGDLSRKSLREMRANKYEEIRVVCITKDLSVVAATDDNLAYMFIAPKPLIDREPDDESMVKTWPVILEGLNERLENTDTHPLFDSGIQYLYHEYPFSYNDEWYVVQIYKRYVREAKILSFLVFAFVTGNLVGIIGTFLIGKYISRKLLEPIVTISKTAERISVEDLTARIDISGPNDEIRELKITFNEMIARLESSFNKQNQFISDASHELRTPISVIQGYANLIDRWGKSDSAILQESIDSIKAETQHMSELVKKLLFLAKDRQNRKQLNMQVISLNNMLEDIVREFHVLEIDHEISLILDKEVKIVGDYDLIKQMLWIFIENSTKYSKAGKANVVLHVFEKDGRSCVSVKDDGIGISGENLPHLFERFFRADKSRSKDIPGSGLGLSIAEWIIKSHEATAHIDSEINIGTEIIVEFPNIMARDVDI